MKLLQDEFSADSEIAEDKHTIVMYVPAKDYERLGNLIGRPHSFIASRLPQRQDDLYIIIRDRESDRQNVFKFWRYTAC